MYVELVLIDNFAMDLILCFLSARICGQSVRIARFCLAAGLGAVYAAAALVYTWLMGTLPRLLIPALMSLLCVHIRRVPAFAGCLYVSAFVTGGAINGISELLGARSAPGFTGAVGLRWVLVGAAAAIIVTEWLVRREVRPGGEYSVTAVILGETVRMSGFVDTGNALRDASGGGVIVTDADALLSQLSPEAAALLRPGSPAVRPFAYSSLGGDGIIYGVMPERLVLEGRGGRFSARAYIAPAKNFKTTVLSGNIRLHRESIKEAENCSARQTL